MKKLHFSTDIKASKEKVWDVLWGDKTYPQWTRAFSEGSQAISDEWQEGSRVQFLDGSGNGMYSVVAKNNPYQFMAFQHLGEVKNKKEMPLDEKSKQWSGSMEEYLLEENGDRIQVSVDVDTTDEMVDQMNEMFPKALARLKELAEH